MVPIMTPEAAIFDFLAGTGLPVYAQTSVPDDAAYPYATVELSIGDFWSGEVSIPVSLWYRGDGEAEPNAGARTLAKMVGRGGKVIPCDDGAVWLRLGDPAIQSLGDSTDDKIKRRYINLTAEFMTN